MASDNKSRPCRGPQESITCKVTWDSRKLVLQSPSPYTSQMEVLRFYAGGRCGKCNQTDIMMLLIPDGEEGPRICQSATLIRSIMVYTGKDSAEHLTNTIEPILEEEDHLERYGLR